MDNDLIYKSIKPETPLSDFVESFWMLQNSSNSAKETIGLPDGRIDLFLSKTPEEPFRISMLGVGTQYFEKGIITANSLRFAISFKLPAIEYIFHKPIPDLLNKGKMLPEDFWNFNEDDLKDFDAFCRKASQKIQSILSKQMDSRKQKLFQLIYDKNGAMPIKQLSDNVGWSSRQMNRYFNQQFGLSVKAFCNILRFRASLNHIAKGELFPEENFTDQNHFIKEIKKFSGVVPKELFKNENDRFILLSTLPSE